MRSLQKFYLFLSFFTALFFGIAAKQVSFAGQNLPEDNYSAVIFSYQRIGDDQRPEQSIRLEQFEAHIRELTEENYNVISLADLIHAYENEISLPDRTVVLTFDGGHKSVVNHAVPLLLKHSLPFTVFISTEKTSQNHGDYLNWDEVRSITKHDLVDVGLHPAKYEHLQSNNKNARLEINNALSLYRKELEREPHFFAYAFGEYDEDYYALIKEYDFKAALGQQSSVAHKDYDRFKLPRFVLTEEYGDLTRFRMLANALPLAITNIEPSTSVIATTKPNIGFSLPENVNAAQLTCFASGQDKPDVQLINQSRVELRLQESFTSMRNRVNCTMPVISPEGGETRWRWFGMLLILPET